MESFHVRKLISKKKQSYRVQDPLRKYLEHHGRCTKLSLDYHDLLRFSNSSPVCDKNGDQTCWISVSYPAWEQKEIFAALIEVYAILKADGNVALMEHLEVDRVDLCLFGNSKPFRIRIINTINDNFDYFYVKKADASRIYGLELEHLLSPNRIGFLISQDTVVIEHIFGIPGDAFILKFMNHNLNEVRLAKEFVKFNERCFLRLLGDMHASNFVVDITLDVEEANYRIRAIDFDQQSYEGRLKVYLPQFFYENNPIVKIGLEALTYRSVKQYQAEERYLISKRLKTANRRFRNLMEVMIQDSIAPEAQVKQLGEELAEHYKKDVFRTCHSMGELVIKSLETIEN